MNEFLVAYDLPKLYQVEIKNLKRPITNNKPQYQTESGQNFFLLNTDVKNSQ